MVRKGFGTLFTFLQGPFFPHSGVHISFSLTFVYFLHHPVPSISLNDRIRISNAVQSWKNFDGFFVHFSFLGKRYIYVAVSSTGYLWKRCMQKKGLILKIEKGQTWNRIFGSEIPFFYFITDACF